jgi:TrmH family RNA methyltransferase
VQSAKGSLLRINIQYVDLKVYLSSKKGVPVYAAALEGTSIHKIDVQPPAILVIGNEANGISTDVMAFATQKVTIPKFGRAESLNAGIATAIILSNLIK